MDDFIFDENSFVREKLLEIGGLLFLGPRGEPSTPRANIAAFSRSAVLVLFRNLKLSFGRRFFIADLRLFDGEGEEGSPYLVYTGLGKGEKLTLLGVRLGVAGTSILAGSSNLASSRDREGTSNASTLRLWCSSCGASSIISVEPRT